MQKEIFEQPRAVRDTLLGAFRRTPEKSFLDEMAITGKAVSRLQQVRIVACGTS